MESPTIRCYSCGNDILLSEGAVSRSETCSNCNSDVRVCFNCKFYDAKSYNECREPSAERVVDKAKSNFCDYFSAGGSASGTGTSKSDALKKLDDLALGIKLKK